MAKLFKNIWFRCITVLLLVIVISGASIAILSDVLYVSPKERTDRGIAKVYGHIVDYDIVYDVDSDVYTLDKLTEKQQKLIKQDKGEITKIYTVGADEVLFQSIGKDGFKGGTVTVWVRVKIKDTTCSIEQVVLEANTNQSLINNLKDSFYSKFKMADVMANLIKDKYFTTKGDGILNPVSGATYSANAGNNAVNCVLKYAREVYASEN